MKARTIAKLIKYMPNWLMKYISKKVVKRYLDKYANINVSGSKNLNNIKTPTIFICNHLSNSDGLVLNRVLKAIDPTFVAGVKLSKNDVTSIGLNVVKTTNIKPNTADKEGLKKVINLVKAGESLLIFPEGSRSRTGSLIEAKKGIVLIAKLTKAPIIPIGIYGTEKLLPISKEGDMASETFRYADVNINIGEQFEIPKMEKGSDKKSYEDEVTLDLMLKIAKLLPDNYRGVYGNMV